MKIKLVSDLHLEFSDIMIPNDANYDLLILSGDILVAQDMHDHPEENVRTAAMLEMLGSRQLKAQRFRDFFKRCSFQFPHVIYVAGNHEFYHGKFFASIDHLREECAKYPNIYFLENDTKIIQDRNHETGEVSDIVFMGATLWTDCNKHDPFTLHALADMMNDFKIIRHDQSGYRSLKPADIADRHRKTLQYFKTTCAVTEVVVEAGVGVVVVGDASWGIVAQSMSSTKNSKSSMAAQPDACGPRTASMRI